MQPPTTRRPTVSSGIVVATLRGADFFFTRRGDLLLFAA